MASAGSFNKAHGSEKSNELMTKSDRDLKEGKMSTTIPSLHKKKIQPLSTTISNSSGNSPITDATKTKRTRRRLRPKKPKENLENVAVSGNTSLNENPLTKLRHKIKPDKLVPFSGKSVNNQVRTTLRKQASNQQPEINYTFTIKPVMSHLSDKVGKLIHRRNTKNKLINIKSFVKNTNSPPLIFVTNKLIITEITRNLSKLSVNESNMTKSERRKYPKNLKSSEPSTSTAKKKRTRERKSLNEPAPFPEYITREEVQLGLESGLLIKGLIRINPKNARNSYVSNEDTSKSDYFVTSVTDRNRALDGDEVILTVKPKSEWTEGKQTAAVVFITKEVHSRITIGTLRPLDNEDGKNAALYPRDKKMPVIRVPLLSCPNGFKSNPKQFEKILFVVRLIEWTVPSYATGVLVENLGLSGDLRVETLSILREFCLDITPFNPEVVTCIPKTKEIPEKEFEYREDIRNECVFTIDPATARDLDDAVSVKELPNGNYEIGVHISDASYFLEEGTELDQIVSQKATTIYLIDSVYHMLPVELCLFCSLLPGEDKLSFSVFWEMNEDGDVINTRFARTIMRSCTQLSYEHAQMIIENPDKDFKDEEFPPIFNGFTARDLKKTVMVLQNISIKLREKRMENGALKIDQVKLQFHLDPKSGEPLEFWKYENKESHRLIEDFMLLANISVAEKINDSFPDIAFLRRHQPPKQTMLVELQNNLATCGIHIDISSSGGIQASLKKYISDDVAGQCRAAVLNHLTAKPMARAKYFCASTVDPDEDDPFNHYALSVPIYTHFTSPIRRYADIMVHRLLAASLGYREKPRWDVDYVAAIAANCNAQKYNAKRAGDASGDLYLAHYIEKRKPYVQDCVVVDVRDRSFDAMVLKTGSIVRIYQNNCDNGTSWKIEAIPTVKSDRDDPEEKGTKIRGENEKKLLKLTISFPQTKQFPKTSLVVEIFTLVQVNLERKPNSYKLEATLLRPVSTQIFSRR